MLVAHKVEGVRKTETPRLGLDEDNRANCIENAMSQTVFARRVIHVTRGNVLLREGA